MNKVRALLVLSGLCVAAGLPPWGWWPLTIAGLALWYYLIDNCKLVVRFGRSLIVGLAWMLPSTFWIIDLTAVGWPVAAIFFALIMALVGAATPSGVAHRRAVSCAALALAELLRSSWPFGGVPISTLAMAGVDTPVAISTRLFGQQILVVLLGLAAVILADLVRRRKTSLVALGFVAVVPAVASIGLFSTNTLGTIEAAVVQGGGPQNTRAELCENREVFERHMAASRLIEEPVDLVVWPEDVVNPAPVTVPARSCPDPVLRRSEAMERISQLAQSLDATLITGWFEPDPEEGGNQNYALATSEGGVAGERYHKVRLVPFGEFVPFRSFVENFSTEVPSRDVLQGDRPAVLQSSLGPLGVVISWEVFFDNRARDAIGNGGAVLLNPTNGSSYWLTMIQSQQVAASKLRALETDRWVLQAAPTGLSAIVSPNGQVVARSDVEEQKVLQEMIEIREGRTLAVFLGVWPVLVGSAGVLVAALAFAIVKAIEARGSNKRSARPNRPTRPARQNGPARPQRPARPRQ